MLRPSILWCWLFLSLLLSSLHPYCLSSPLYPNYYDPDIPGGDDDTMYREVYDESSNYDSPEEIRGRGADQGESWTRFPNEGPKKGDEFTPVTPPMTPDDDPGPPSGSKLPICKTNEPNDSEKGPGGASWTRFPPNTTPCIMPSLRSFYRSKRRSNFDLNEIPYDDYPPSYDNRPFDRR